MKRADAERERTAVMSRCKRYRFELRRVWGPGNSLVMFVGLNPSTADQTTDDPTVRRWRGFAKAWGHDGMIVVNAHPLRSTDPRALKTHEYRGDEYAYNLKTIARLVAECDRVVCCWGANLPREHERTLVKELRTAAHFHGLELQHLGLTREGQPKHPLYLRGDTQPEVWAP